MRFTQNESKRVYDIRVVRMKENCLHEYDSLSSQNRQLPYTSYFENELIFSLIFISILKHIVQKDSEPNYKSHDESIKSIEITVIEAE